MRVAFFVPSFPEISETFILRQVVGLLERKHDVRIFAYEPARGGRVHEAVAKHGLTDLVRVLPNRKDRTSTRAVSPTRGPAPRRVGASLRAATCLRREHARGVGGWPTLLRTLAVLRDEGPFDVVHCHYGVMGTRYGFTATLWRAPLVVSFYGYDASSYPREHGAGVYRSLFGDAAAVTVLSEHMAGRLRELGCPPDLLRRVPLAVDPDGCDPAARAARRDEVAPVRLLTVARLVEKKGIELALRAVGVVVHEYPALEYEIVGDGPLMRELVDLTSALGLANVVRFAGAQTQAYVAEALRRADLFLLPSVTAANGDQEGTPTAILEAALCGLPVLGTLHAGIPEIVQDGVSGCLVPERDVDALASGLRSLLRAPERWPAMGAAGRRYVEAHHTTAIVAERLERVYEEARAR